MNLYFDTEFTGLHKDTTLISIGIISEDGRTFYAELNDYDKTQIDDWLQENVINNLSYNGSAPFKEELSCKAESKRSVIAKGNIKEVSEALLEWTKQFEDIKIWSDCLAYDWVLFNHLFGHAFNLPKNIYYIPFDICTLFEIKGIDPDISREEFINNSIEGKKHNALYDAKVIKACYDKLTAPIYLELETIPSDEELLDSLRKEHLRIQSSCGVNIKRS